MDEVMVRDGECIKSVSVIIRSILTVIFSGVQPSENEVPRMHDLL